MLTKNVKLAWHFFKQEYQHSHQRLLRLTQGILLLFIVTLSQTSESIQDYLENNLQGLLGADAVLSQKQALTADQYAAVHELTNKIVVTQQIQATLTHNDKWQPAKLKAVNNSYPLQGELLTSLTLQQQGKQTLGGPKPGSVWLDSRLFASLALTIGDQILVADKPLVVSRVLQHEPDRLMEGHNVDMRAMVNTMDFEALGFAPDLIHYRYLIAATSDQISTLLKWQQKNLPAAQVHHKQGAHPLALFWQRTENFIGLASIILFFMAAIAIDQLAQVHIKKDQYFSAICMSLGASKTTGMQVSLFKWLISLALLLPLVLLLSALFHWLITYWLQETFINLHWQFNFFSMLKTTSCVTIIFAVFHAPVWFALHKASVAKLFISTNKEADHWFSKVSSILVLLGIVITYSDNGLLTLMMVAAIVITIGLMILLSWGTLTVGEKVTQNISGLIPFALFMMKQRLVSKSTQIMGVGLCAFLLLFTLMLLKDVGATMASYQRQHDGNVMVSQATQSQLTFIKGWAKQQNIMIRQAKPYMYAKLVAVNDQSLTEFSQKPSDSLATFTRPIRLHWNDSIPQNNKIVDGQWWQSNNKNWQQISVEQEVLTDMGLELGDWLRFYIGQQSFNFEITASHEFKPGAGSITFWVQMPLAALPHIQSPHYSMASIEINEQQWPLLTNLWQKFPTLRMVSLKAMTDRFDAILAMITKVISGFSLMIICLSAVVILASINALESKEMKKNSVVMSFGFSQSTCLRLNIIEWLVTALITAIGAISGTYIAGLMIYQSQFSLTYKPDFIWLIATLSIVLIVVTSFGVYASRKSLRSSVRQLISAN
ncbi:FtsX-like permease family protein [Thalassotalea fonticola]|uniref:FtsX-like permease family protein n=1 Tax=Thalassotalea fonticola TaxID=3065649 RepID=A0ABZ0GLA1_9GAMM|nr:FtsX-like permease family protein [Colwelliaceae bacterium S1-1]